MLDMRDKKSGVNLLFFIMRIRHILLIMFYQVL